MSESNIILLEKERTKTFSAAAWPELYREQQGRFARVFTGDDRVAIKEASTSVFSRSELADMKPPKGYFGVHRTIMGAEEAYGFNINGDSYPEKMLERDHPTFVSHGRIYREHDHKHPSKAIGVIKAARYNPRSKRVETVEHVEIKKAEREYEEARTGKELLASQSCRIPFDECSVCGNKAAKAAQYCGDIKRYLKQLVPGRNKFAFMRNNHCTFFDSSIVATPADITAKPHSYWFADEDSIKVASTLNQVIFVDEKAASANVLPISYDEARVLRLCAELEDPMRPDVFRDKVASMACPEVKLTVPQLQAVRQLQPGTFFCKLAHRRVLLPFDAFAAYVLDKSLDDVRQDPDVIKSASSLPGIFRALADALDGAECCCDREDVEMFRPFDSVTAACDPNNKDEVDRVMDAFADEAGFHDEPVKQRAIRIVIVKRASANADFKVPPPSEVDRLALAYGLYKVAAIASMKLNEIEQHKLAAYAVMQNCSFAA